MGSKRREQVQKVLERETVRSALVLRRILGPIHLTPIMPQVGRPDLQAETALQSWTWSKTRRAVRLHQNGGGGGHRTHVRKSSATGIYIHSRFSCALATPPSNRLVVRAASS